MTVVKTAILPCRNSFSLLFGLFCIQLFQFCTPSSEMDKNGVVPDVIDKIPPKIVEVTYADGIKVQMGNELTPTKVKDPPTVQWETEPGVFYLLCMTDPDAPSRKDPQFREWHHWLVGNISGCDVTKACVISEYIGSGPPKDTGLHRYVFLVYKQPKKLLFAEKKLTNKSGDGRGKFSIRNFAAKYRLGEPIAGNFFQAQWDDYVPTLYKQLGM
ncbi:protein D2-like [Agrilus planipennis]|uniref:Protein D2-like n=1 Tax=Agrilus planipennis TaxID=224129 RepID=A0A1W4WQ54_AGRPL|nr:protein D2-like [Agrilus planipennis]